MKKCIIWSLTGLFLWAGFSFLCHVPQACAEEAVTWQLTNPTGGVEITQLHAARLGDLAGKTICEVSVDTWQSHRTFPAIRQALQNKYPTAKIIPFTEFPQGIKGIDDDKTAQMVQDRGCQAAIVGNAG
jgi:hypothetical protein